MEDEKRKDDYDIELGEKDGQSFSPARPAERIPVRGRDITGFTGTMEISKCGLSPM